MSIAEDAVRLRMAVVGCGSMEAHHARDIVALADRIEPVVPVDPERYRAVRAAGNLGIARVAADVNDVLDEIDAALVVTPHHLQYDIGMTLLQAGKHVLMEKPLALSEDECLELIHLSHRVGRVLMTAYPMRCSGTKISSPTTRSCRSNLPGCSPRTSSEWWRSR